MRTAIVTDSNSGITPQMAKEMGISVIAMPFMIDGTVFYENVSLSKEEFYQRQTDGAAISTSQPAPEDILSLWDKLLEDHDEIVHIPMSSSLSGSCQTAYMLSDRYHGKVQVVDNRRISVTQKRSVQDALELAAKGMQAAQIKEELEKASLDSSIYITLETLQYLKQGGRITPAAAAIGTLLRIKPVLKIKGERLDAFSKARTMAHGKSVMISAMHHDVDTLFGGIEAGNVWMYAVQGSMPAQFPSFAREVRNGFPGIAVEEDSLPLSIACHIGPGALAIACSRKI